MILLKTQNGSSWIIIVILIALITSLGMYSFHYKTLAKERIKYQTEIDKLNYHIQQLTLEKNTLQYNIDRILAEQDTIETEPVSPPVQETTQNVQPDIEQYGGTDMLSLLKANIQISDELQRAKIKIEEINEIKNNLEKQLALMQHKLYFRSDNS